MKRALVTGSAGFVGRHMVEALMRDGYDVVGWDIANTIPNDCRRAFDAVPVESHFDLVVHCAAVVGGRTMIDGEPLRLAAEDLSIDAALFRWALRARPERIVYFSSSAAYPVNMQHAGVEVRLSERHHTPRLPGCDQTYGAVKVIGERLAAEANAEGITTHVFRPFSGYGGDQALDYPFPSIVARAARREDPFKIWGRADSARDWIHIDDIVGAALAAVDQGVLGPVNLCTGRATTFEQLATMCMDRAGYRAPIESDMHAPQGVHWRVGDPTRMLEFYRPRITLEEGIARALVDLERAA